MEPYEALMFEKQRRAILDRNVDLQAKEMEVEFTKTNAALRRRFEYYVNHYSIQLRKIINIRKNLPNTFTLLEVRDLEDKYNAAIKVLKADMYDSKDGEPMYKVRIWPPPKRWSREIEIVWLAKWGVDIVTSTMTNVYTVETSRTPDGKDLSDTFKSIDILIWRTIIETEGMWKQIHNFVL